MALKVCTKSFEDNDEQFDIERQQHEFNNAHNESNKGYYIIINHNLYTYVLSDYILELIHTHRPSYKYVTYIDSEDPSSDIYKVVVSLFIEVITGKLKVCENILSNHLLLWVSADIIQSGGWMFTYSSESTFKEYNWEYYNENNDINFIISHSIIYSYNKHETEMRTLLSTINKIIETSDDPLPLMIGLLNPLLQLSPDENVLSNIKETIELATFLPGFGEEYKKANERFN